MPRAEVLAFALKHAGYRFQIQSLLNALARDRAIVWPDYSRCTLRGFEAARRRLRQLGVAPNGRGVDLVAERCREVLKSAVGAYYERLAG
jgi:hypothetical protein